VRSSRALKKVDSQSALYCLAGVATGGLLIEAVLDGCIEVVPRHESMIAVAAITALTRIETLVILNSFAKVLIAFPIEFPDAFVSFRVVWSEPLTIAKERVSVSGPYYS
jgi:hypothetical protein